jgi:hypothetical protein
MNRAQVGSDFGGLALLGLLYFLASFSYYFIAVAKQNMGLHPLFS